MDDELSPVLQALYEGRRDDAQRLAGELDVLEAAALGRLDVLRSHLDGDPDALSARTPDGFTALHLAAFFGGGAAVRALLAAGASAEADADNRLGVRPLHSAAAAGDHDAVRALLEAGADPNVRQQGGYTPLLQAAHTDDPELTRMLLDHGADRTMAADDGRDAAAMAGPRTKELLG
jgi:ankyrin repeat protein